MFGAIRTFRFSGETERAVQVSRKGGHPLGFGIWQLVRLEVASQLCRWHAV